MAARADPVHWSGRDLGFTIERRPIRSSRWTRPDLHAKVPFVPTPRFLLPFLLIALAGCASARHETCAPIPIAPEGGIVYSADGAGSFTSMTDSLAGAIRDSHTPLRIELVDWSHGYGRILSDQLDYANIRCEGKRLAERVLLQKRAFPDTPVHLVGHSAGCAVILAAAEELPPASIEHIVLLLPAVSADYDLRPSLRCARLGIDSFHSRLDLGYLGIGTTVLGTTDRRWTAAAGRVGFRPLCCSADDEQLHANLRQHPWNIAVSWTGNSGGHYGVHQPCFLTSYVLPILLNSPR